MPNDPVLTLILPRSVALTALAALGKLPLEAVALHYTTLERAIQAGERMLQEQMIETEFARRKVAEQEG